MQMKFLPHLQIWFHKRVNIHKRAAEGEEGIRAEKARHAGTDTLRSIYSFISSVSIFMTFQQSCFKRNPTKADYSATNTPASKKKKRRHPLSVYWGLSVPPPSSDPPSVFAASHERERWPFPLTTATESSFWAAGAGVSAQTHNSLMIDRNPARSGSLTVRQHQSWYSPALHRNPYERKSFCRGGAVGWWCWWCWWVGGVKSGTEPERGGNWQIPSWQGSWSYAVDTPTWHLSLWRSLLLSLSLFFFSFS